MSFLSSVSLTTASTVRVPVETAMRSRCEFVKSGSDGRDRAFPADRGSRFEPREAKREPRPCRRRVDAAATPVRLSDRVDDREPEADATMRTRAETPCAWRNLGPAHEDILQECLYVDLFHDDEVRLIRLCEEQEPVEDAFDSLELVEGDAHLRLWRPIGPR